MSDSNNNSRESSKSSASSTTKNTTKKTKNIPRYGLSPMRHSISTPSLPSHFSKLPSTRNKIQRHRQQLQQQQQQLHPPFPGILEERNDDRRDSKGSRGSRHTLGSDGDDDSDADSIHAHEQREYQKYLMNVVKADIPFLKKSFLLCPHKHHCVQNAFMKGLWRTFAAAFVFKTSLALLTSLFAGKIIRYDGAHKLKLSLNLRKIQAIYTNTDSLIFAQFLGLMSFTYKAMLCLLRRWRLKDPIWHKSVAGFVSAFWIFLDIKSRRKTLALYCFVRAFSDVVKLCCAYKILPTIANFDVLSFTVSQILIMLGAIKYPKRLDPKYYKWIKNMGAISEYQIQQCFRSPSGTSNWRLPHEPFVPCSPIWHKEHSCLAWSSKDWVFAFGRAMRMYLPVHFLPMILFQPKKVLEQPMDYIHRKFRNSMVSSAFLATYVFNMKTTLCFMRNWIKEDVWYIPVCGGIATGLSLFLENPHRRPELCLYCIPRSMEFVFNSFSVERFPRVYHLLRWYWTPILSFQTAVALWMTVIAIPKGIENSNSINMTVVKIVFGSKH